MLEFKSQALLSLLAKACLYRVDMIFKDRLRQARKDRSPKTTQVDIANLVGVSPQAVSGWERGEAMPEPDKLLKIANFLGKSVGWLLGDDADTSIAPAATIRPAGPETSDVEVVSEGWPTVTGEWMDIRGVTVGGPDTGFFFGDVVDHVRRPPGIRNAKHVAALNTVGDSMIPRFKPGELVYVQLREPAPGDDVVVELYPENEGEAPKAFLKELVKTTGRRIFCKQHNPKKDIEFDRGEVHRLWRVIPLRDLLG